MNRIDTFYPSKNDRYNQEAQANAMRVEPSLPKAYFNAANQVQMAPKESLTTSYGITPQGAQDGLDKNASGPSPATQYAMGEARGAAAGGAGVGGTLLAGGTGHMLATGAVTAGGAATAGAGLALMYLQKQNEKRIAQEQQERDNFLTKQQRELSMWQSLTNQLSNQNIS